MIKNQCPRVVVTEYQRKNVLEVLIQERNTAEALEKKKHTAESTRAYICIRSLDDQIKSQCKMKSCGDLCVVMVLCSSNVVQSSGFV